METIAHAAAELCPAAAARKERLTSMNKADILTRLHDFPYPLGDFWLITGAALVVHGVRDETADVDMGCTKAAADRLEADGFLYRLTSDGKRWFKLGGEVEVFEDWRCGSVETVCGVPVLSLAGLREMKLSMGREKDLRDVRLIEAFLAGAKDGA